MDPFWIPPIIALVLIIIQIIYNLRHPKTTLAGKLKMLQDENEALKQRIERLERAVAVMRSGNTGKTE